MAKGAQANHNLQKKTTCILFHSHTYTHLRSASTIRCPNAVLKSAHRLRRWPNINPALDQRMVFAGNYYLGIWCVWCIVCLQEAVFIYHRKMK